MPLLFMLLTLLTSLGLKAQDILDVGRNYRPTLIALTASHILYPAVVFAMMKAFGLDGSIEQGVILSQIMPAGVTAVAWAGLARGHIGTVVSMITISTAIAPAAVPLTLILYYGESIGFDTAEIAFGLAVYVLVPCALGMLFGHLVPQRGERAKSVTSLVSKALLLIIVLLNAASVAGPAMRGGGQIGRAAMLMGVLIVGGYAINWGVLYVLKLQRPLEIAYTFSSSVRNYTAALVLAHLYLPPDAAVPIMAAVLLQHPAALLANVLFSLRFRNRRMQPSIAER
ncbi:bile acid:sodium symporter family protein [Cohnella lubricantis]|uniref:Bile acid:sodium symporter family protein n=1 Tax=Cohnella lubricantis TaxID=2163172 RepID=A0A841TGM1_9BACL|nr:bile acid:sodium symporter [Cohnella lubricantis]MBB6678408.1 bile acid:sodium symporter family protein [Cohnella lubricantis]MBP2116788.1 putative Na+-dependent transporter [Cohnella lubricantis]